MVVDVYMLQSGQILVDDVLASSHSDWLLDGLVPARFTHYLPAVYQSIMALAFLLYRYGTAIWCALISLLDFMGEESQGAQCQAQLGEKLFCVAQSREQRLCSSPMFYCICCQILSLFLSLDQE